MKYVFTVAVFLLSFSMSFAATDTAVSGSSASGTEVIATSTGDLSIKTIKTLDDRHIRVVFTEPVDAESIILKIKKTSDNSDIRINMLTGVTDAPEAVELTLWDDLVEASAYSVTVVAAVAASWATITDGAQALKSFTTPQPIKKSAITLNAPANPSAVIASSSKDPETKTGTTQTKTLEPKKPTPTPTEELPLTGMNPLWFLLLAFPVSYLFLKRRTL